MNDPRVRMGAAVVAVAIATWFLARALASDETRIRWAIEDAVESLNDMKAGSTAAILAEDFRDGTSGATRPLVEAYLRRAFLLRQNRHEGAFRYPMAIREGSLEIVLDEPSEGRARAVATAEFRDASADDAVVWEVELDAVFDELDGDWLMRAATYETKSGRPPF